MAGIPAAAAPDPGSNPGFGLDERASLALCVADPSSFDSGSVLEFLVRVDAELSRLAADRVRLLAELSARDASQDRWVAEEVGAALRLSPSRAMTEVKNAVQLHGSLPRTFAQLAAGQVTAGQARLVAEASYRLPLTPAPWQRSISRPRHGAARCQGRRPGSFCDGRYCGPTRPAPNGATSWLRAIDMCGLSKPRTAWRC